MNDELTVAMSEEEVVEFRRCFTLLFVAPNSLIDENINLMMMLKIIIKLVDLRIGSRPAVDAALVGGEDPQSFGSA